jgi:hypothetical protein
VFRPEVPAGVWPTVAARIAMPKKLIPKPTISMLSAVEPSCFGLGIGNIATTAPTTTVIGSKLRQRNNQFPVLVNSRCKPMLKTALLDINGILRLQTQRCKLQMKVAER